MNITDNLLNVPHYKTMVERMSLKKKKSGFDPWLCNRQLSLGMFLKFSNL